MAAAIAVSIIALVLSSSLGVAIVEGKNWTPGAGLGDLDLIPNPLPMGSFGTSRFVDRAADTDLVTLLSSVPLFGSTGGSQLSSDSSCPLEPVKRLGRYLLMKVGLGRNLWW